MKKLVSYNPTALGFSINITVIIMALLTLAMPLIVPHLVQVGWGVDQLDYLPGSLYYIWLALGLMAALALFLSPREHFLSRAVERYFWGDKKILGRTIFLLVALVIFFLLRFDAHFYGSGYIRLSNFAQRAKPIFKWSEYGGTAVPYLLYSLLKFLGVAKLASAEWAYRTISLLSGLGFIFVSFRISHAIALGNHDRIAFFFMIIFSGLTLLFFGMVENFPALLLLAVVFIYLLFMLNQTGKSKYLYLLWGMTVLGLFFDLQFIAVLPAAVFVTCKFHIKRRVGKTIGILAGLAVILAGIIIVYAKASGDIALANLILFFSGKPPDVDYSLFSLQHVADLANLVFLFVPLVIIFTFAIIAGLSSSGKDSNFIGLGLLTLAQIAYLFIVDPKNGMARDFPLFIFLLTGFLFWGIYSLMKMKLERKLSQDIFMALCPISLLVALPLFYVHLSPNISEKYIDDYLAYNDTKYEPALIAFRDYYISEKRDSLAIQKERAVAGKAPGALESQIVNDLYAQERVDEALQYAVSLVERFPYNGTYRMQKGNILKYYKRISEAEKELKTALELDPYNTDFYHYLSELYRETGREKECLDVINRALSVDPKSTVMLVDLTGYYYRAKQAKEMDSLTSVIIEIDPKEPYAYMYRGLLSEARGDGQSALENYRKFIELNERLPEIATIRKRMNDIVLKMQDSTSQK